LTIRRKKFRRHYAWGKKARGVPLLPSSGQRMCRKRISGHLVLVGKKKRTAVETCQMMSRKKRKGGPMVLSAGKAYEEAFEAEQARGDEEKMDQA